MSDTSKTISPKPRRDPWPWIRWTVYILLTLVAVEPEIGGELFSTIGISAGADKPIALSGLYQRFVTAGYQKPRPHYTRIVILSPSFEPQSIFGDVCKKREFEAALLQSLKKVAPAAVVFDFWFSPRTCKDGDDAIREGKLRSAIAESSSLFPVVLGLSSHTEHELSLDQDPDLNGLEKAGLTDTDQVLDPRLDLAGKYLSYGLVRIDADTRRIPISWNVFRDKSSVLAHSKREPRSSLAYVAAGNRDRQLQNVLGKINRADEHPFTSFIPESQFEPVHAIELLCGRMLKEDEDWTKCSSPDVDSDSRFSRLKGGQIILVAENSQRDHYQSVVGEVPGYLLQANYIESLLDSRYFRPLPPFWELILTALGVVLIVISFEKVSSLVARRTTATVGLFAGLLSGYGVVIVLAVISNVIGVYLGWFVGFWLPLIPIPILELIFKLRSAWANPPEQNKAEQKTAA